MIDSGLAQDIAHALRSGTVPAEGLEHFAVGLEPQMEALREQFDYAAGGKSAYRFVRGPYGSGKTFLSTLASAEALKAGFLTSKVVVSTTDTPLHKPAQVYRQLCQGLTTTSRRGGALQSLVDRWLLQLEEQVIELDGLDEHSPRFGAAVAARVERQLAPVGERAGRMAACLRGYHQCQLADDYATARALLDWVSGEPKVAASLKKVAGVTGTLDNTDALVFLRGLLELIRTSGHKGLLLVLDEVETLLRQSRTQQRQGGLEVLRGLVDAIDKNEYPGLVLIVTGTPDFFDNQKGVPSLEPLHDRIRVDFRNDRPDNLRAPQLRLFPFDEERLLKVARRVRDIYPATHPERIERRVDEGLIQDMVDTITRGFGGRIEVVPRLFLREFLNVLDLVDLHDYDPRSQYAFSADRVAEGGLSAEEELVLDREARELFL